MIARLLALACAVLATSGCASVAVTLAGLGAGIGANHFIGNVATRTFTASQDELKWATTAALKRMKVEVDAVEATAKSGEMIRGRTSGREFQIELEPVSPTVTRVRAVVRMEGGVTLDGATANEVIAQTDRSLATREAAAVPPPQITPAALAAMSAPAAAEAQAAFAATIAPESLAQRARPTATPARAVTPQRAARAPAAAAPPSPPR